MYNVHIIIPIYYTTQATFRMQPQSSSFRPDFDRVVVVVYSLLYSISTQHSIYYYSAVGAIRQCWFSLLINIIKLMSVLTVLYAKKLRTIKKYHQIIKNCNLQHIDDTFTVINIYIYITYR
jgi:hypothetical protein